MNYTYTIFSVIGGLTLNPDIRDIA
jgi:hypothetical protein